MGTTRRTEARAATQDEIAEVWRKRWGVPIITPRGSHDPPDVEGLVAVRGGDLPTGLVTWKVDGSRAEIVTLDAWPTGDGVGALLLAAAESQLRAQGVTCVALVTCNDNVRALSFYVRKGYRLLRVHLDAMVEVRARKPGVPLTGVDDVPLLDMWELEKHLR